MKKMRKFRETILKLSITAALSIATFPSCKEGGEKVPFIQFEHVKEFTRDSLRTYMEYEGMYNRLSLIRYQVEENIRSSSSVTYTAQGMICTIDTLTYDVKLAATVGGSRAFSVTASIKDATVYYVEYQFDAAGKLTLAKVIIPGDNNGAGSEQWVSYNYTADNIEINEGNAIYNIPLSTEENTGYVCNAYAFAEAPLTNRYIINPDLYFLNIYGMPVEQLPAGETIQRIGANDSRLSRVGKFYYTYY